MRASHWSPLMQLFGIGLVVLAMPLSTRIAGMPHLRAFDGLNGERSPVPALMVAGVLTLLHEPEVAGLVVGAVLVVVMNNESNRHFAAVRVLPDHLVKAHTIALKILPAQVIPESVELLNCWRNDANFHEDTWMP